MQDFDKMLKKKENIEQTTMTEFNDLIESIKKASKLNEEAISKRMGYNEGYISQTRSRGKVPPKLFKNLLREFRDELHENPPTPKENHIETRNHLKELGESKRGIMVYESAPVQAGFNTVYHDEHAVPDYVLNIPQFRDCNYGTRASGDSMYPEIRNGDLVICKEINLNARIIYGDIYIIHTRDGETIKYIHPFPPHEKDQQWILAVPLNKAAAGTGTPIPREEITKLFKVRAIFKAY